MQLFEPNYKNLHFVAQNMRQMDWEEVHATRFSDNEPEAVAAMCDAMSTVKYVAGRETPIVAMGAAMMWPGVWSVWMFATDDLSSIGHAMTKLAKKAILEVENVGAHRIECRSMSTHTEAHRWLNYLGFEQEGPEMIGYGKNGENFKVFVWKQ